MTFLELCTLVVNFGLLGWVIGKKRKANASWRQEWPAGAALIVTLAHLGIDGARWQMIPGYAAPIFIGLYMVYRRNKTGRRKWWVVVPSFVVLTIYAVVSFFLPAVMPIFQFAKPTGSYSIGTRVIHLQDAGKELMVQSWYPSEVGSSDKRTAYIQDVPEVTTALSKMLGFPGGTFRHLAHIRTHAYWETKLSSSEPSYPVLIFSHGLGGVRNQNTFQMEELASHGYIVLSIDYPTYAAATVFPDGRVVRDEHQNLVGAETAEQDRHMNDWATEATFVLDQLDKLNGSEWFQHKMDLQRIGMLGHSYGGSTSVYMLQNDARVKAALNMDGGIFGLPVDFKLLHKPLFMMAADASLDVEAFNKSLDSYTEDEVLKQSGKPKAWHKANMDDLMARRERMLAAGALALVLPNSSHLTFSDLPLYAPLLFAPKGDLKRKHVIINKYTVAFFDYYLKGDKTSFSRIESYPNVQFHGL
ncbi:alpha/beta fold hydrolase [Paenibacillus sp. FSL H7-0756]|uniref:alpha/beta hydrolase family protein n=1 Tax=unclassified Paenibacillus TaxID=185978 RepID=UPI0030FB09A8